MKKLVKNICGIMLMVIVLGTVTSMGVASHAAGIKYIRTEEELRDAIKNHSITENYIALNNDIYLDGDLKVDKYTFIDLRSHKITFRDGKYGIRVQMKDYGGLRMKDGRIYGACDSDSAIDIVSGTLSLTNVDVYGGRIKNYKYVAVGNALYSAAQNTNIYLNRVSLEGGGGYAEGYEIGNRTAKALYVEYPSCSVHSVGKGHTILDGIPGYLD